MAEKVTAGWGECGKINLRMESLGADSCTSPRLMDSFVAGFNLVSNHLYLVLMPMGLDVLLWLGPRVGVSELLERRFLTWTRQVGELSPSALSSLVTFQTLVMDAARQQNLLSILSTLPVGLPSMMAWKGGRQTPFGAAWDVQLASEGGAALFCLGCVLVGLALGCIYFSLLARMTAFSLPRWRWRLVVGQFLQSLILMAIFLALLLLAGVPALLLLMVAASLSVEVAGFFVILLAAGAVFLLFPLIFTVQGLFVTGLAAADALYMSMILVRRCLPGVGLFVLMALLLAQGLDMLWKSSASDSWLMLMGIGARAFIYTAILAASFIYYRSGLMMLAQQSRPRWKLI